MPHAEVNHKILEKNNSYFIFEKIDPAIQVVSGNSPKISKAKQIRT